MPVPGRASAGYFNGPYQATHITTNATTNIVSAANAANAIQAGGVLHSICINAKGATSNLCTVNIDGVTIAIVDTTANVGTVFFDVGFAQSLQIVTSAGTAADLTVTWFSQN